MSDAFAFFNAKLFDGRQQNCMITLRNHGNSLGYHAEDRFATVAGEKFPEIAINPRFLLSRSLPDNLSTVVHEMAHEFQRVAGKPSRNGYHNRQWGQMMKVIGLHPSHTGLPGGRETGQQMNHYIVAGGPFDAACTELLATGFSLRYGDIWKAKERKPPKAVKFTCPSCNRIAKAEPDMHLACIDCRAIMVCSVPVATVAEQFEVAA